MAWKRLSTEHQAIFILHDDRSIVAANDLMLLIEHGDVHPSVLDALRKHAAVDAAGGFQSSMLTEGGTDCGFGVSSRASVRVG